MNQEKMVVGIGEALWDVLPEGEEDRWRTR